MAITNAMARTTTAEDAHDWRELGIFLGLIALFIVALMVGPYATDRFLFWLHRNAPSGDAIAPHDWITERSGHLEFSRPRGWHLWKPPTPIFYNDSSPIVFEDSSLRFYIDLGYVEAPMPLFTGNRTYQYMRIDQKVAKLSLTDREISLYIPRARGRMNLVASAICEKTKCDLSEARTALSSIRFHDN